MSGYALAQTARRHLTHIREYFQAAPEHIREREILRIRAAFEQVAQFRESGRIEFDLRSRSGVVRSVLSYPYRIYYLPQTDPVRIIAIRDGRQEPVRTGTVM